VRIIVAALAAAIALGSLQAPAPPAVTPDREAAYRANNLGAALLEQFSYDEAAKAFHESLRLAPNLDIARLNLAIADLYAGRLAEAAAGARAAAGRMPSSPHAHYVAGLVAKTDNRGDDAAAAFARVLEIDPLDAGALVSLGQVRLQERRYTDALPLFERALAAEPYNVTAAYSAALALTRGGRADEGRAAMQRFEQLRDSAYGVTYAQSYLTQGRYAEAIVSTGAEPELVNAAAPAVTFSDATSASFGARATIAAPAAGAAGSVTLFDADGDDDLDLIAADAAGLRLFRNEAGRFTDDSGRAGLGSVREAAGAVAGDVDNDGRPDLFVMGAARSRLFRQKADGTFEDVTAAAGLPAPPPNPAAAAFADLDHDGDLDLVVAGERAQLLRNNGNGTFTDITAASGLAARLGRTVAVAPTDYDNRRDLDLAIATAEAPRLFRNMRDGTFRESAAEAGLTAPGENTALAVADVNKDGYPDVFLGRADGPGVLALSDARGRFRITPAPEGTRAAIAAQFVDYDNDGVLDLLTLSRDGVRLNRNIGGGRWSDVSGAASLAGLAPGAATTFQSMALGDLDGDGDTDVVLRTAAGGIRVARNDGGSRNASLRVRLAPRVSNRSAAGAKIELRAGSLRQVLETASSSPAVSPGDLVFGLGSRPSADVVRVLWPSGILQAETATAPARGTRDLTVAELDRKPSSCPNLYTWNGTRFEFITDFMGGGEMGDWMGPATWNDPDPTEYVRIRGDQLQPRNGRYEIRVTNELEETLFVDRLRLIAVDHAAGVEVYPNEGLIGPPRPPFGITAVRGAHPPVAAADDDGRDLLPRIAAIDRLYADGFPLERIRGYAATHALTLDLGPGGDRGVLLLTGWTDYAFSGDNLAAHQGGVSLAPPVLQVKDGRGGWRTAIDTIGIPIGRPQTVVVDLRGKLPPGTREVRLVTNMRIYWDQILVDVSGGGFRTALTRLDPIAADLRWRGFSAESSPDGREPYGYDYERVSTVSPWKVMTGRYTREGDVRTLLRHTDDMFVVSRPGDEIALSFDATALPPPRPGMSRTFLLHADGYSKEMNINSASPHTVAPLPFHGMRGYPYGPDEHYPRTPAHLEYLARYNTRAVTRPVPAIEIATKGARQ